MKTMENLSQKNSTKKTDKKIVPMNVTPTKSVRPQKSMMRVKSIRPNRAILAEKIQIKKS